jgi:signal transduction histidine kinase
MFAQPGLNDMPVRPVIPGSNAGPSAKPSRHSGRAAQKVSALGDMTGGIAHDFRNVLCVIASGLRVAERNVADPSKFKSALAAAEEGIERGLKMVAELLAFARQQERNAGPEEVNPLLAGLEAFLRYGAGPGVTLVLELASDLPKSLVDPQRFNAAILNLVVNARDAMPGGGVIRITTTMAIGTQLGKGGDYVRVRVCDNGTGMPKDVIRNMFNPYFTTKGDRGTGLGVPQVQALMQQIGGYVAVDSIVGKGTTFDLYFPVHEEQPTSRSSRGVNSTVGPMKARRLAEARDGSRNLLSGAS